MTLRWPTWFLKPSVWTPRPVFSAFSPEASSPPTASTETQSQEMFFRQQLCAPLSPASYRVLFFFFPVGVTNISKLQTLNMIEG